MMPFFSRTAVCNTGPLIGLARAGLECLPFRLFPKVIFPLEVVRELTCLESPDAGRIRSSLEEATIPENPTYVDPLLLAELDAGEAAVISMAVNLGDAVAILDERKARKVARQIYGLHVKGTAGLLVQAKRIGLIADVGTAIEAMLAGGYYLSHSLVAATLREAGEE